MQRKYDAKDKYFACQIVHLIQAKTKNLIYIYTPNLFVMIYSRNRALPIYRISFSSVLHFNHILIFQQCFIFNIFMINLQHKLFKFLSC